jgi:4-diphosphocytidyl-2-C-methyl-D-erythritol kinase
MLAALAARLGSDVPFFLTGGAALVSGRGERMRPLPLAAWLPVLLVNPGFPSSTAEAFARLDAYRASKAGDAGRFPDNLEDFVVIMTKLLNQEPAEWPFGNDFLPVLREAGTGAGVYDRILGELRAAGAGFSGLSGAGSSCFGVFPSEIAVSEAENIMKKRWSFVQKTFFLAFLPLPVLDW